MKGGARKQPAAAAAAQQPPMSPTGKVAAKYTNRTGDKFITMPNSATADSALPSPTISAASAGKLPTSIAGAGTGSGSGLEGPPVNRKKQKRRQKAAAKAAAEAGANGVPVNGASRADASTNREGQRHNHHDRADDSDEEDENSDSHHQHGYDQENGYSPSGKAGKSKKKRKKGNAAPTTSGHPSNHKSHPSQSSVTHGSSGISKERIWNTSSQEERERIKEFWLGLQEDERKGLVKVEKDAVLKKMKEQQKHTCSCTVCGRKRNAIEEELEGLYDAYYEELEQFAHHPHQGHPPMMGTSRHFGLHAPRGFSANYTGHQPSHGRIVEHVGDDEEDEAEEEEEYSDDDLEEDDEYSDEEPEEEVPRDYASDFLNFGSSLTVQGGILTVADDLLKNDGKKFIEMMEQLAERRMAREEDSNKEQYPRGYGHNVNGGNLPGHNHPPPLAPVEDDEYEDDEEDEEYESQEEEYEEEDDDTMTEEQRMEEGRRMFQIFAARMFEQRVLQAYREKIAKERQAKLMEEEDEDARREEQRREKRAKEAQKRKEKAQQKKAALAEEKARKEAEKAAEEDARLKEEARKADDAKRKAEEKRRKKEAQKKAEEEERLRREAERRLQKERQAEQERKAREAKEREKQAREEARVKEKEAREQKEREARERKEKQELDKRQKELRKETSKLKAEMDSDQKQKQEERAAKKASALAAPVPVTMTLPKRPAQPHAANSASAIPALPQHPPTAFASPKPAIAVPALPKAPTPMRPRQPSHQDTHASAISRTASQAGSGASQNPSPHPNTPGHTSASPIGAHGRGSMASHQSGQPAHTMSPPLVSTGKMPSMAQQFPYDNMSPMGGMTFPPGLPQPMPNGFSNRPHQEPAMFPPIGPGYGRPLPGMMPIPPGFSGPIGGRGFPAPPGFTSPALDHLSLFGSVPKDSALGLHSRQPSGGYDSPSGVSSHPIQRPGPIGRPSSVVHGQRRPPSGSPSRAGPKGSEDVLDRHLGSSALLDDDEPLHAMQDFGSRRSIGAPGLGPGSRMAFPQVPFGGSIDPATLFGSPSVSSMWGHSNIPPPPGLNPFTPGPPAPPVLGFGPSSWASPSLAFSVPRTMGRTNQANQARPVQSVMVRQMLCRACMDLSEKARLEQPVNGSSQSEPFNDGFVQLDSIKEYVNNEVKNFSSLGLGEKTPTEDELLALCETEGNTQNGGGTFDVRDEGSTKGIRWNPSADGMPSSNGVGRVPGIGSPIVGSGWGSPIVGSGWGR